MQRSDDDGRTDRSRRSRFRSGVVATGAAFAISVGTIGFAAAQTDQPDNQPAPDEQTERGWKQPGRGHHRAFTGIHGEFTTRAPGGGFQTMATQSGEVTTVERSAVTVRSEDGYSRSYAVDDNTMVNAGNDGIADVKQGDQVQVIAVVADGGARAVDVRDVTQSRALRERWVPPRR